MSPRLVAAPLPVEPSSAGLIERVWSAGAALLPLGPASTEQERAALLARMKPHVVLDGAEEVALDEGVPVEDRTAVVIATSGTSGPPKGVVLGHTALAAAARLTNERVGAEQGQRWLCCLPLWHIAGLMTVLRSRALGTEAIFHRRFDVEAVGAETGAAFVSVVPTMLRRLLEADVDLSRYSRILVGGAAADDELVERARSRGARVSVTYGMSETAGGVVYDGVPLAGVDIDLDDEGRISIASPTLMNGYRLDPAATEAALVGGRFVSQDRGEWDEDGRLRVLERFDRTIITGGKNVSPREVEEALLAHPEVLEAIVRGEADAHWGRRIVAEVTPSDPRRPPTQEALTAFLRDRLSSYKIPVEIRLVSDR